MRGENMDQTPIELPGFRFHPTEEELLNFYLKNMINDRKMPLDIISFLNIYRFEPWDLPGLAKIGEREWYFFVPRDRKASNGGRPNRTTEHGFWKATGSDRKIFSLSEPKRSIGLRKTLVFYQGRAPRGTKTDWIMNEYRLPDDYHLHKEIVLCKIYRKATSLKELEQRAAKEEEKSTMPLYPTSPLSSSNDNNHSFLGDYSSGTSSEPFSQDFFPPMPMSSTLKKEEKYVETYCNTTAILQYNPIKMELNCFNNSNNNNNNIDVSSSTTSNTLKLPFGKDGLELQVPKSGMSMSTGTDWAQDPLCAQICSPWLENLLNNFSSPTLISQLL